MSTEGHIIEPTNPKKLAEQLGKLGAQPILPKRTQILDTARDLINGDRAQSYGSYGEQMLGLSRMFNGLTGKDLSPADCSKFLLCLKLRRMETAQDTDSEVDLCGYAALHAEFFK